MPSDSSWFHKMSPEDQQATLKAGYKPVSDAAAGANSGRLRAIETREHLTGRLITTFEGDCDVWMDLFKSPVKQRVVRFPLAAQIK